MDTRVWVIGIRVFRIWLRESHLDVEAFINMIIHKNLKHMIRLLFDNHQIFLPYRGYCLYLLFYNFNISFSFSNNNNLFFLFILLLFFLRFFNFILFGLFLDFLFNFLVSFVVLVWSAFHF